MPKCFILTIRQIRHSKTCRELGRAVSNFAAVQACCVVTVRLPQTRYFQYCPFVLPVCQALALFQNPGRLAQRCLKLSSMKTLLCTDLTGKNTALFRTENSRLLQACLISYVLLSSLFPRKCADTRNSLSDHKQQPKGSKQEDLTLSKTS